MLCPFCSYDNIEGVDSCNRCNVDLSDMQGLADASDIERDLLDRPLSQLASVSYVEVGPSDTVRATVSKWGKDGFHCALIVSDGSLAGIFTERDLLFKLANDFETLADQPISTFMTPNPETLTHDAPVAFALNKMMVGGYRHIPIVQGEKLVGMVSVRDILGYMVDRFGDVLSAVSSK